MIHTPKVLVVDDQLVTQTMARDFVTSLGYPCETVNNGLLALEHINTSSFDLVLLDLDMPVMNGIAVLNKLKILPMTSKPSIIVISSMSHTEQIAHCIQLGAEDYLIKPFDRILLKACIEATLEKRVLIEQREKFRIQLTQYNMQLENIVQKQVDEISRAHMGVLFCMSKLAESRDSETGKHLERMSLYCRISGMQLAQTHRYENQINTEYVSNLYRASPLHDIGKVGIPDEILLKPEKLTTAEFEIMKTHTIIGAKTLADAIQRVPSNFVLKTAHDIAISHHEKWDGSGYPQQLEGTNIPLSSRILALADVYDALTSKRCYKEAFSHKESRDIICAGRGKHFDPIVVDAFLEIQEKFIEIAEFHTDNDEVEVA